MRVWHGAIPYEQSLRGWRPSKRSAIQATASRALRMAARPWPTPRISTIVTRLPAAHSFV
jgi:hypothetical protein